MTIQRTTKALAPWIAIPVNHGRIGQNFSSGIESEFVASSFVRMVEAEGGIPILLSPLTSQKQIAQIADQMDGLLLTSGQDLDPSTYGADPLVRYEAAISGVGREFLRPQTFAPNLVRDQFELALYRAMRRQNKPVLGICRGFQLINVGESGTLYQELPKTSLSHCIEPDGWIPYHDLVLEKNSKLHHLIGKDRISVPSVHHQGIHKLGKALRAVGFSEDGLIEAIELKDSSAGFVVGVQGHIEKVLGNYQDYCRLGAAFVSEASHLKVNSLRTSVGSTMSTKIGSKAGAKRSVRVRAKTGTRKGIVP